MDDDMLPAYAEKLIEGEPDTPIEAPRSRRSFPVEEIWREGDRYLGLRVPVDDEYRASYRRPGQYVTLSPEQLDPRFLVIANAPDGADDRSWEFLVDRQTQLGASLDPLERGATLEISPPEGPGYPTDDVAGMDVVCFVTGSGIASVRPAVEYWARRPGLAPRDLTVYYGENDPADFAYTDEVDDWTNQGVRLVYCDETDSTASSEFRYVQEAFRSDDPELEDPVFFIAGASVMKRRVVDLLVERGVPLDRIVTNV